MADGSSNSFHGRCLSPGMADGPILVQDHFDDGFQGGDVPRPDTPIVSRQVDAEHSLLDHAVEQVTEDLLQLAAKVEREISAPLGQVFDAHRLIANDDSLRTEMRREITENLVGAGTAVRIVFGRWEERLLQMKSNISKSKSDDMADVSRRLRDALGRVLHPALAGIPSGCVLIRNRLLPSDTIILSDHLPAAIILDHGSHGSHAALFVREMDLPCIVGCAGLRERVGAHRGIHALVDADVGVVSVAPDPSSCERFQRKQRRNDLLRRRSILRAQAPAITIDGTHVKVMANVGSVKDAKSAAKSGADGIGLLRVEQLYLGRLSPPDVDELVAVLRPILEPFRGMPTCVRLLDAGADKISINTAAVRDPQLIAEAARHFGSQCVVLAIDAKATPAGWRVFLNGGREATEIDPVEFAMKGAELGAGEILLTSMNADGTKSGFETALTREVSTKVAVPVIASGGAGKMDDFADVLISGRADAALAASVFHFGEIGVPELKSFLRMRGIEVRI